LATERGFIGRRLAGADSIFRRTALRAGLAMKKGEALTPADAKRVAVQAQMRIMCGLTLHHRQTLGRAATPREDTALGAKATALAEADARRIFAGLLIGEKPTKKKLAREMALGLLYGEHTGPDGPIPPLSNNAVAALLRAVGLSPSLYAANQFVDRLVRDHGPRPRWRHNSEKVGTRSRPAKV
jgi:hypothetical protein